MGKMIGNDSREDHLFYKGRVLPNNIGAWNTKEELDKLVEEYDRKNGRNAKNEKNSKNAGNHNSKSFYAGKELPAGTKAFEPTEKYAKLVGKKVAPEGTVIEFEKGKETERQPS
jgi:hypothetical protein